MWKIGGMEGKKNLRKEGGKEELGVPWEDSLAAHTP